jgi:hypothetical protein
MNHQEICLDLSVPLHMRMDALRHLTLDEIDNLIECVCSVYNIHPTYTSLQYLQHLILNERPCLKRRVRIAESCDLGRTVLYLLTRISNIQERISCIEMFSNPYLKFHAYCALFYRVDIEVQIQIMKNIHSLKFLSSIQNDMLTWFKTQVENEQLKYKYRSNCADFILRYAPIQSDAYQVARIFLKLVGKIRNIYDHAENVHLFVPKPKVLEELVSKTSSRCDLDDILGFISDHHYDLGLFRARIINDKTFLGTLQHSCTLEDLIRIVWLELTEDLRHILIQDLQSSISFGEETEWMCTTGYYNRILNVYQVMSGNDCLIETDKLEQQEFIQVMIQRINHYLYQDEHKEDIILELPEHSEALRMKFMTFKVHTLPQLIQELKQRYSHLTQDIFDDYFSNGLRQYEGLL